MEGEEGGGALSGLAVNGAASGGYSPPEVVHLAMYFEDVMMDRAPVPQPAT